MTQRLVILTILFVVIVFFAYQGIRALTLKREAAKGIQRIPSINLTRVDGTHNNLNELDSRKNLIVILFSSECPYCHDKALQLERHADTLTDHLIVFVSAEPLSQIDRFRGDMGLDCLPNFQFYQASSEDIFSTFGTRKVPSVWIYGLDNQIITGREGNLIFYIDQICE
ncbi:MAG: hypothetical protein AAF149_06925 [Bacteroidota bacterium]